MSRQIADAKRMTAPVGVMGLAILIFSCTGSPTSSGPAVPDGSVAADVSPVSDATVGVPIVHPSMYFTEDRRENIETHIASEPMASIYARIQEVAESELDDIDSADWDAKAHGKNGEIAAANAFLAWLNDDSSAAERALAAIERLESNWDDHIGWGINIRMPAPLIHYTAAWDLLKATPYFSEEDADGLQAKLTEITGQFFDAYVLDDSTRQLALTVTQNNHPIRTASAIGFVAVAFLEHPDAQNWLDWAVSELAYLMGPDGRYVQADGVISEGPFYFNYGFAPTLPFYIALENRVSIERTYHRNCIARSDVDPWAGHGCVDGEGFTYTNPMDTPLFRKILDWSLALRLPNGNRAPIGDSPLRDQSGQAIFTHFGGADYLYWDWASNPSKPYSVKGGFELALTHLAYVEPLEDVGPPEWKNRFFIEGGMATFRSGWGSDDRVLILMGENGPARKTVHDHTDGTSFVLAAYGDLLLTDTGYYKPNSLQNAVTAASGAHNLILIDGEGAPPKGLLNDWGDADAFIENTHDGIKLAYAESRQSYQDTMVTRAVAFVRERYFIIADRLESPEDRERTYQFRLHAYAGYDLDGTVTLETHGPRIERSSGGLAVYTQASQGTCTLEEPPFTENALPHVHKLDGSAAHHTVTDSIATGRAPDFLTVLAPYKVGVSEGPDQPLDVTPIETTNGVAWQIAGDGHVDIAWVRETGAPGQLETASGQTIQTDAAFVFLSLDGAQSLMARGTELRLGETLLLFNADGDEVVVSGTSPDGRP